MITYYHRNVEEDCLVLFFCSASIGTLFERQRSWTVSWSFSLRLSYSDWMQQVFRTSGDIFELLPVSNCFRFCIFRLCLFACVHALYLKIAHVFLCFHACIRNPEIQVQRWPCRSQALGSEVRLVTSTEHPGGGKGLHLHTIQIAHDTGCYL